MSAWAVAIAACEVAIAICASLIALVYFAIKAFTLAIFAFALYTIADNNDNFVFSSAINWFVLVILFLVSSRLFDAEETTLLAEL